MKTTSKLLLCTALLSSLAFGFVFSPLWLHEARDLSIAVTAAARYQPASSIPVQSLSHAQFVQAMRLGA